MEVSELYLQTSSAVGLQHLSPGLVVPGLSVHGILFVLLPILFLALIDWRFKRQDHNGADRDADPKHASVIKLVTATWSALLGAAYPVDQSSSAGCISVEAFLEAMAVQSKSSQRLGGFMHLVRLCDEKNIRTIRRSWEAHGQPATLRALVEAEKRGGVQRAPGRLKESATLALLWSARMIEFWLGIVRVLADPQRLRTAKGGAEPVKGLDGNPDALLAAHAANVLYAGAIEPYHGFLLRQAFRAALRTLPGREELLRRLYPPPLPSAPGPTGVPPSPSQSEEASEEAVRARVEECERCAAVTERVVGTLRSLLDELQLHDDQRV